MSDERFDEADWPVPEPPADFADRVVGAWGAERTRARRLGWIAGGAAAAVLSAAAAFALFAGNPPEPRSGDVVATNRQEVEIAPGVLAVMERYAHVAWSATGVVQDRGDVSYRVAPGARLSVQTPAGEVASESATSRIKVDAGAPGVVPAVYVAVSRGEIEVRRPDARVRLAAGRYARVDGERVRTDADDADGAIASALALVSARPVAPPSPPGPPAPPPPSATFAPPVSPSSGKPRATPSASAPPPVAPSASAAPRPFRQPACVCAPTDSLCDCP